MPANSSGQLAIWQDADAVATFALSLADTGVRVRKTQTPSTTIELPQTEPNDGDEYQIIDADGSSSPMSAIVVVPPPGTTIQGATNYTSTVQRAALTVVFDNEASDWTVANADGGPNGPIVNSLDGSNRFPITNASSTAEQVNLNLRKSGRFAASGMAVGTTNTPGVSVTVTLFWMNDGAPPPPPQNVMRQVTQASDAAGHFAFTLYSVLNFPVGVPRAGFGVSVAVAAPASFTSAAGGLAVSATEL
jgi:hypothetical protein